jgi:hypothetical protein
MQLPPKRVIAVALMLMAGGIRSVYAFVPRSYPAGLMLPLFSDIFVILAGICLLCRMEWARLLSLAIYWVAVVTSGVYLLLLSYAMIAPGTGASLHKLAVVAIVSSGFGALIWAIWALHSQRARTWTSKDDLPNQSAQPTQPPGG